MRMLVLLISLFFLSRCSGSSCDEFTVGSCNPDPSHTILALDLPNSGGQWELCNDLCSAKLHCTYWSLSCTNTSCLCSLLKYSYLHSCEVVGGGLGTDVEICLEQRSGDCGDLVDEDCELKGQEVWSEEAIVSATECSEFLDLLSSAFGAQYFQYDNHAHICRLYSGADHECVSVSARKGDFVGGCLTSTAPTTPPTLTSASSESPPTTPATKPTTYYPLPTTSKAVPVLPEHCTNYSILDSPTRNSMFDGYGLYCDNFHYYDNDPIIDINHEHVRPDWKGDGWYRVFGEAGTKIVDKAAPYANCGTAATGWLSGGHPSPEEGMVTRTVYFSYGDHDYSGTVDVSVVNCNNFFYVYYLVDIPYCIFGYCTE